MSDDLFRVSSITVSFFFKGLMVSIIFYHSLGIFIETFFFKSQYWYNTGTNFYTSIVHNVSILVYQYCDRQVQEIHILYIIHMYFNLGLLLMRSTSTNKVTVSAVVFFRILRFPAPIKLTATIYLLKYC
jgi:hypothetical protein